MKTHPKRERTINNLTPDEITTLRKVTLDTLQVGVLSEWSDDNEPCIGVNINGVRISFWWLIPKAIGAFYYAADPGGALRARRVVMEILEYQLKRLDNTRHSKDLGKDENTTEPQII